MTAKVDPDSGGLTEIWKPLDIGPTRVKNRIMMSPHRQAFAEDNAPSDRQIAYWVERAKGGVALIGGESTSVSRQLARASQESGPSGWRQNAWAASSIPAFARLADAVHEHGCRVFMEMSYFGANQRSRADIDDWQPIRGSSAVPSPMCVDIPLPMDQAFIDDLVTDYGRSAANLMSAGLDGVEIHAAHGYMPMQFLSPAFNKRTDRYGGSIENRSRLLVEIGRSIRERVGTNITVGMRLSFDEYIGSAGLTPEMAEEYLEIFAATGYFDFFSISSGSYHSFQYAVPPMGSVEDAFLVPYGKRAKAVVGERAKIFLAGRVLDLDTAERVLSEGAADMVAMVRAHIADPHVIRKTREGRTAEIYRCTGANDCLATGFEGSRMHCVTNPAVGRERVWGQGTIRIATARKRVVVVGGGPAAMRFAGVAAARGHEVVLLERQGQFGGRVNLLKRLPTRGDWQALVDNFQIDLDKHAVDAHTGVTATAGLVEEEEPEVIVVATGARWQQSGFSTGRPDRDAIPGVEAEHVIDVATATERALADPNSLGKRVVILDDAGGYLPLGLAEVLGNAGVEVEIVSRFPTVGSSLDATLDRPFLMARLAASDVTLRPGQFVESIDGNTVEAYMVWNRKPRMLSGIDTVVLAMLRDPDDGLATELEKAGIAPVHRIGDALTPRTIAEAVVDGEKLARQL